MTPYPQLDDSMLAAGTAYVYPPILAFATAPFLLVPDGWVTPVGVVAGVVIVALVLAIAGVRDWRCYGAAMLWPAVTDGLLSLNVSLLLALVLVSSWRLRRRPLASGVLLGTMVAVKLFVWPLLVWPLAMRRWRSAVVAAVSLVLVVLVPWSAIGFAGLRQYPDLLQQLSDLEGPESYSISASLGVLRVAPELARAGALSSGSPL